ncbi:hypothetical protein EST38_g10380 [Candolleomyces aberdarensis]|uniref:Uncharacterized protein n=1 Tax=Candolleomyces aberdarensis TaxID=2316362 RepID=A0A4Q2D955_9AGAR|nr:hypothetical protein EST38_g10380 [Candolleomyces aberdarensis]
MVAVRLLPFATAVLLGVLHAELATARPLHKNGLSLRSLGSEAYDDGALALREPFDEDSLEEYFSREPVTTSPPPPPPPPAKGPKGSPGGPSRAPTPPPSPPPPPANPPTPAPGNPLRGNNPAKSKGERSFDEDDIQDLVRRIILSEAEIRLNFPQPARPPTPPVPGNPANNKPLPARPATPPPPVPGKPANNKPLPAKPNGKRSFDEDDFVDLVQRIVLSDAEVELNFNPPPRVPGKPANNKPLPARPPPVPGKPANNKPLPAKPNGKRSFDEDEFERRAILEEIVEELLRRDYFVDMDLD